jgi:ATP-dependent Clp protease ATP-binding subunit ClpA
MPRETAEPDPMSNFTPHAQQVLALSRLEADRFHHSFVGTEHLLLGLIRLGEGCAVNALKKMGVNLEEVRDEIANAIGIGPEQNRTPGTIEYTPRVKKVLALAAKEAKALQHSYVGTEHLLLGFLREGDNVAARVLRNHDVEPEIAREFVLRELDPNFTPPLESIGVRENTGEEEQQPVSIDLSKRYDVYCYEGSREVVYRNALFKGMKTLFKRSAEDALSEFIELEQESGQTIFIARSSVRKFCEHGATPGSEGVPGSEV